MCIICNMHDEAGMRAASDFLSEYSAAQEAMKRATAAMLKCAQDSEQYDRTHKAMVKIMRDWNRLEHLREHRSAPQPE